jgi:hypothetical protein
MSFKSDENLKLYIVLHYFTALTGHVQLCHNLVWNFMFFSLSTRIQRNQAQKQL